MESKKKIEGGCKCAPARTYAAPPKPSRYKVASRVGTEPPPRPVVRSVPQRVPTKPPKPKTGK